MNCREFREQWSEWHEGDGAVPGDAMAAHRRDCAACARYDRQMRRMIAELGQLPLPGEVPAAGRRRHAPGPRWLALAATLVVGVALGVMLAPRFNGGARLHAEPVSLDGPGVHRVAVSFETPKQLRTVEFVVELPPGVELVGFPGQRSVRWQGRLAAGRSQLQLPLRVTSGAELGTLVTRVVHETGERRLEVPLRLGDGEVRDDTA